MSRPWIVIMLTAIVTFNTAEAGATPGPNQCLPPGIAGDFLTWKTDHAQALSIATESGPERAGLLERYQAEDGRSTVVLWVRGKIVLVDANPDNPAIPSWIDTGLIASNGKRLLDTPQSPCQWRMLGGSQARAIAG